MKRCRKMQIIVKKVLQLNSILHMRKSKRMSNAKVRVDLIRHSENMLHNLSCLETRFELLCVDDLLHSSLNLVFRQHKLHKTFIFGMAYSWEDMKDNVTSD